jgi:NTE family protein
MKDDLALVLGGGGAHAAYQIGFLRSLAGHFPDLRIPIVTGISAGAINAAFIANYQGTFAECIDALSSFWLRLSIDKIFKADSWSILKSLLHWGIYFLSGGIPRTSSPKGLVDTMPLRFLLEKGFTASKEGMIGIHENIQQKKLKAIAITTTNYSTGQSVTWVQGKNIEIWERPDRHAVMTDITVEQIMASTALPILFPAVRIGDSWYGDGGIRHYSPLSPALHLGARRIIAVSTRYRPSLEETRPSAHREYPSVSNIMDNLMNAIFVEHLDQDALWLDRINRLLEHQAMPEDHKLKIVRTFTLRPSVNLSKIAGQYEPDLPRSFRSLTRRFGTREAGNFDWLSMVMFDARYIKILMDIGEADAGVRIGEISALLS